MEKEILHRFFEQRTSAEEEKRLLDWLDEDPRHHRELLAERKLYDATLMLAPSGKRNVRQRFWAPLWVRRSIRYAALLAVAAGLGGAFVSHRYEELLQGHNTISVPAGQHIDLELADGTKVSLNAFSELRYPAAFRGRERKVQLKGEAFFEVTHDAEHPFVVETYAYDVEVLGTKFDVEAHPDTDEFVTSLVEGSVRVSDRENSNLGVLLHPAQQASRRDGRLVVKPLPEHEHFLWREGLLAFRDASFADLIREFERCYGVKFVTGRTELPETLLTGKIRVAEGVDHALWVLQQSVDFRYTRNETSNTIYIH